MSMSSVFTMLPSFDSFPPQDSVLCLIAFILLPCTKSIIKVTADTLEFRIALLSKSKQRYSWDIEGEGNISYPTAV